MFDRVEFCVLGSFLLPARAVPLPPHKQRGNALRATLDGLELARYRNHFVVSGSLAKYVRGENAGEMTLAQTREALDRLETELGFSIREARVWSLELGRTLIMRHPPAQYISMLGELPGYNLTIYPNGNRLYFRGLHSVLLYDKTLEMAKKKKAMPELYRGRNLLRLEYKLKARLARQLRIVLTVGHLTDEAIYVTLLKRWKRFALAIPMGRAARPILDGDFKNTKESLAGVALCSIPGLTESVLAGITARTDLSNDERSRRKRELLALTTKPNWTEPTALAQELTDRIRDAVRSFR